MNFEISPMVVTQVNLSENNDSQPVDEHPNAFSLGASVLFNPEQNTAATLVVNAHLISYGKFEVTLTSEFVIHFEKEMTEEEAANAVEEARTEATIFPYVSSYMSTLISLSGYQRPSIPIVVL